jgi:hypothetical protein
MVKMQFESREAEAEAQVHYAGWQDYDKRATSFLLG